MAAPSDTSASAARHVGAILGWLLCLAVPAVIFFGLTEAQMQQNSAVFLAIVTLPIVMWPFGLLPDFVPGLLAVVLILLVGAAPPDVVLSGFSSNGFLLIIAILGLGALIRTSGLVGRLASLMLERLPGRVPAYAGTIFACGLILTPFLPSPAGRLAVIAPLIHQLEQRIGKQISARGRTLIYVAGVDGATLLTAAFLTAAPVNLIIYSMLPEQERFAFQFADWVIAASVAAAVLVLGFVLLACLITFDGSAVEQATGKEASSAPRPLSREDVQQIAGLQAIAPSALSAPFHHVTKTAPGIPERLSRREWGAIAGIACLGLGVLSTPLHLIPAPVLAFLIFSLLFAVEIMEQPDFVREIDWSFIFLLGALVGFTNTAQYLGLTDRLVAEIAWLGTILREDFQQFVLILSGVIVAARLVVPQTATTLVLVTALLPLAEASGISPWVVGFVILVLTDAVILDYQSPMHRVYRINCGMAGRIAENRVLALRVLMIAVRIGAIYASIPFWEAAGFL